MDLQVLVSCMGQRDCSIVKKSVITTDVVVVNQCDSDIAIEISDENRMIKMINTTERGLSNSRNMAICNADADICVLADDDEVFCDGYKQTILKAFNEIPDADIIVFDLNNWKKPISKRIKKLGKWYSMKISSVQIAFKLKSIKMNHIQFDTRLGAGTGNGAGEENKFLLDCYKKKLKVYYYPAVVATLLTDDSTWFSGYTEKYFYCKGRVIRYIYGSLIAIIYGCYFICSKRKIYRNEISAFQAMKLYICGYRDQL